MDKGNDEAERLRRALPPRAECGWGCFCDACWYASGVATSRHLTEHRDDALGAELAAYDALWRLSFGVDEVPAPEVQEARSLLERLDRTDDL